jgi:hypothetical protein
MRLAGIVRNREGYCYGVEFRAVVANSSAPVRTGQAAPAVPATSARPQLGETNRPEIDENAASYAAVCRELAAAEDKLATLLQRRLETNMSQHDPEFKRMCLKMLRIREVRRQMESLTMNR